MGFKVEDITHSRRVDGVDARGLYIVGIGGTTRPLSGTERVLSRALEPARRAGAHVELLGADRLDLPLYRPGAAEVSGRARRLLASVRQADGVIVASPGYHGTISGLVKNALDYLEELREDERPYLHNRGVGCIALAGGAQAAVATLDTLRTVAHALRGWPTPMGAALVAEEGLFGPEGEVADDRAAAQLELIGTQVLDLAMLRRVKRHRAA